MDPPLRDDVDDHRRTEGVCGKGVKSPIAMILSRPDSAEEPEDDADEELKALVVGIIIVSLVALVVLVVAWVW